MRHKGWLPQVLLPFALSRAALLLVGLLALGLLGSARELMPGNLVAHDPAPLPLEVWASWDAEWYLLIAQYGYDSGERLDSYSLDYHREDTAGFFPLYPLLIRMLWLLGFSPVAAGILVSNSSLLVALSLFKRLLEEAGRSEEVTSRTLWALLCFPTSFFLSAVYSESTALALVLASFLLARKGNWAGLGVTGFFCALARPTGMLVALALIWELWEKRVGWRGWLSLLGFPAGLAAFCLYCQRVFGDPFVWASRQARWRGTMLYPGRAFVRFFGEPAQLHGAHNSLLEFCFALIFVLALVPLLRRYPRAWGVYAVVTVLVPLSSTLWSFSRLALGCFPFFALVGESPGSAGRGFPAYLVMVLPLGGFLMALFACGWWAG